MLAPSEPANNQGRPYQIGLGDERYAASYLAVSVETLRTWRKKDRGPRYRRIGRCIRYSIADLLAFVETAPSGGGRAVSPPKTKRSNPPAVSSDVQITYPVEGA